MIIETFRPGKVAEIYQRLEKKGRLQPQGLTYINSWIDEHMGTCYQVMETDSIENLYEWMENWSEAGVFRSRASERVVN